MLPAAVHPHPARAESEGKVNPDSNAFPTPEKVWGDQHGLTKRELFAAMAMQGVIGNATLAKVLNQGAAEFGKDAAGFTAQLAREFADALIAELSKEQP